MPCLKRAFRLVPPAKRQAEDAGYEKRQVGGQITEIGNPRKRAFVGEVVMTTETTPFLAAARAKGCATQVGTDMLFEQIPAYLEFFGLRSTTPDQLRRLAELDI